MKNDTDPSLDPDPSVAGKRMLDMTGDRIVEQFSSLIPQVHLTLVSILQGLALAALFTSTKPPAGFTWGYLWIALTVHHFYLPHLVSLLIVVTAWMEYVYGIIYVHWPVRARWIALQFVVVIPEVAAFSSVDSVGAWSFWIGIMSLVACLITGDNIKLVSASLYNKKHWQLIREQNDNTLYWALAIFLTLLGWLREAHVLFPSAAIPLPGVWGNLHTGVVYDLLIPIVLLYVFIRSLRRDDRHYSHFIETVLRDSGSRYSMQSGIIMLRPAPAREDANE